MTTEGKRHSDHLLLPHPRRRDISSEGKGIIEGLKEQVETAADTLFDEVSEQFTGFKLGLGQGFSGGIEFFPIVRHGRDILHRIRQIKALNGSKGKETPTFTEKIAAHAISLGIYHYLESLTEEQMQIVFPDAAQRDWVLMRIRHSKSIAEQHKDERVDEYIEEQIKRGNRNDVIIPPAQLNQIQIFDYPMDEIYDLLSGQERIHKDIVVPPHGIIHRRQRVIPHVSIPIRSKLFAKDSSPRKIVLQAIKHGLISKDSIENEAVKEGNYYISESEYVRKAALSHIRRTEYLATPLGILSATGSIALLGFRRRIRQSVVEALGIKGAATLAGKAILFATAPQILAGISITNLSLIAIDSLLKLGESALAANVVEKSLAQLAQINDLPEQIDRYLDSNLEKI